MRPDLQRLGGVAWALLAVMATAAQDARPPSGSIADALEHYQPGRSVVAALPRDVLWSGAGDFRREASSWVDAGGPTDAPRRRLVVATYVLDLLKDVEEPSLWQDSQAAPTLVEWACAKLREAPPLSVDAERAWHVAAIALLERSSTVTVLERQLEHAESRVPDGDRWPLVRALIDERRSQGRPREDGTLAVSEGTEARAARHFDEAASRPSVRQEALLRWGAYESELGHPDAALARFDQIGDLRDPFLRYWLGLLRGRALRRLNRPEEAIVAYRSAMLEFPSAQSGALGLAAALVGVHRTTEASAIVSRAVAADANASMPDPWTMYQSPDVRLWPGALDALRTAVTP